VTTTPPTLESLTRLALDEICGVFGMPPEAHWRGFLESLFQRTARGLASFGATFDQKVAQWGLDGAASWAVTMFASEVLVDGREAIPADGPLIIAANHPGSVDALAITSQIPRADLKVVASGLGFLRHLPELSRHLIYVPRDDTQGRMGVVRAVIRHLAEGGAILIFPGGNIEPDPAVLPGAPDALGSWSNSLEVVLRRVPQAQVVVSIVSGVLTRAALRNPLSPFVRTMRDRQKVAEIVQVGLQMLLRTPLGLAPRVTFTRLPADEPREARMAQLINAARRQIDEHTSRWEKRPGDQRPMAA
jgi:1-acyl-sn-glycerol-3-phosphate acyltransferase